MPFHSPLSLTYNCFHSVHVKPWDTKVHGTNLELNDRGGMERVTGVIRKSLTMLLVHLCWVLKMSKTLPDYKCGESVPGEESCTITWKIVNTLMPFFFINDSILTKLFIQYLMIFWGTDTPC